MNEQDDTKLWQILGHASQPAPGDDFARKVMMRIEREECAPAVPVESIHHFKRHSQKGAVRRWKALPGRIRRY